MTRGPEALRRLLPVLSVALPVTIIFVAVLSIVLTAAGPEGLGLSESQTSTWIIALYGLPAIPSLLLTIRYRQPMLLTGNVFAIIFFASLKGNIGFAELAGASLLAGAIVLWRRPSVLPDGSGSGSPPPSSTASSPAPSSRSSSTSSPR